MFTKAPTLEDIKKTHVHSIRHGDPKVVKKLYEGAFGVEGSAVKELKNTVMSMEFGSKWPPIDLEFLRMRQRSGWPRFAVYNLDDTQCCFQVEERSYIGGQWFQTSSIPKVLHPYFEDVYRRLKRKGRKVRLAHQVNPFIETQAKFTITQVFAGLIPLVVRKKIQRAEKGSFSNLLLVTEAEKWKLSKVVEHRPKQVVDPLIIGLIENQAYLITSFELTPTEEMVAREFTEGEM